jgi:hypothetical protein
MISLEGMTAERTATLARQIEKALVEMDRSVLGSP